MTVIVFIGAPAEIVNLNEIIPSQSNDATDVYSLHSENSVFGNDETNPEINTGMPYIRSTYAYYIMYIIYVYHII